MPESSVTAPVPKPQESFASVRGNLVSLLSIPLAFAIVHIVTNGRYGFHRDEWQFLADAKHLDWGFVSYPPLAPFLARISMSLFGLSLVGIRLFSVAAQTGALILTVLMARALGGGRLAESTAALSLALSPLPNWEATKFQYTSFDYFWWVLITYFVMRLLRSENPRWWIFIGAAVGVGLLTKYSILFYVAGLLAGLAFTRVRRYVWTRWFWAAVGMAALVALPNLLWQVRHEFISYRFLQSINARDISQGRTDGYWSDQLLHCINVVAAPLCIAGLIGYLRSRCYRALAWMYLVPLILFGLARGRGYYVGGSYPMLLAMGSVVAEGWVFRVSKAASRRKLDRPSPAAKTQLPGPSLRRWALLAVFFSCLTIWGSWICALLIPFQSKGPLRDFALKRNEDLRDEFGWSDLLRTVASIRDSLPPEQQERLGIVAGNYGEHGALELLGPTYNLPAPVSGMNSAWLRGYPTPQPTTLIVLGFSREWVDVLFIGCRPSGHAGNSEGIRNEESENHPEIFVCGPPRRPWREFWADFQQFG